MNAIETDYLIVGAGAAGMAFADSLLSDSDATMVLVDRRDKPGGHWNDAYPFVRLHQPAAFYGVNSRPLGSGAKDTVGLNKGMYELASGQEVLSHFDLVMQERFLTSGRVRFVPMSEVDGDGVITSLLSGERTTVTARKTVDAAYSNTAVPSTHPPEYAVEEGVTCVPVNELPRAARGRRRFVVVGAGKTGMDACIWLLQNGAAPDSIHWVMPRDSWLLDRKIFQPGDEFLEPAVKGLADHVEALANAESVDDAIARMERTGYIRRIDPNVTPAAYHCAVASDAELEQLRRIDNIIRLGRVKRIEHERMVLERGTVETEPDWLFVDCSAAGIPKRTPAPIFDGDRITLQFVRLCQPTFSAALIGHVEAVMHANDEEKNRICRPIPPPGEPRDLVSMMSAELANRHTWSQMAELSDWQAASRLDGFTKRLRSLTGTETEVIAHLERYAEHVAAAATNVERLLAAAPT